MAVSFQQTNANAAAGALIASCSGNSNNTDKESNQAQQGGTAGTTERIVTLDGNAVDLNAVWMEIVNIDAYDGASGTWTWRINITTANMQITLDEVHICHVSSSYALKNTLGGATGLGLGLGSTGVQSGNITQSASVSIAPGDRILVIFAFDNGTGGGMTGDIGYTPDQIITGPGTFSAPDLIATLPRYPDRVDPPQALGSQFQAGAHFMAPYPQPDTQISGDTGGGAVPSSRRQTQYSALSGPVFVRREVRLAGQLDQGVPVSRRQVQYGALAGPVSVPAAAAATDEFAWRAVADLPPARSSFLAAMAPAVFFAFALANLPVPARAWDGVYPDHVDPPQGLHASQQVAAFKSPLPQPAAPARSWAPIYPDQHLRPERVLDPPWLAWNPNTPTVEDTFGWRGVYPDLAWHAPPPHASQQIAYWKSPLPQPAAPDLSWGPLYPSWIDPPQGLPAAQHRAWFKAELPQPAAPALSWRGVYADVARSDTVHASRVPATFFHPEPITAEEFFGWRGSYPDRIDRVETHPSRASSAFAPAQSPSAQTPPALSWHPTYVDFARVVSLAPAHRPTVWKSPLPQETPPDLVATLPVYPARLDPPRALGVAQQWVFGFDPAPITITIDQFGWPGVFADHVDRRDVDAAQQAAYFRPVHPLAASPDRAWAPLYPDVWLAPARVLDPPTHFWSTFTPAAADETQFGWRGVYPDAARVDVVDAAQQPFLFRAEIPQPAAPAVSWHPAYPDQLFAPGRVDAPPAVFWSTVTPAPLDTFAWRASYLDRVVTQPTVDTSSTLAWSTFTPTAVDTFAWRAVYPDAIARDEVRAADQRAYFKSPLPQAAAPALSWKAVQPDFARTWVVDAAAQPVFAWSTFTPAVVIDELAWRPTYPDFARVAILHPSAIPTIFRRTGTPEILPEPVVKPSACPLPLPDLPTFE